jgi:hypothetical protein
MATKPVVIKVQAESGPRGPRGFPLFLKGSKGFPSELSGQYRVGEDLFQGLQFGDEGFEDPVIGWAYIIGKDIWVYDDIEAWINAGEIRSGIQIGAVNAINPDRAPEVFDVGQGFDAVFDFNLPRAATISLGEVSELNPDQSPEVEFSVEDGDVEVDFRIPRASNVSVGDTVTSDPGSPALVTNSGVDGDVILDFVLPRGPTGPSDTAVANVLYVSADGDDLGEGDSLAAPFATIKKALSVAQSGTTIFVKSGDYTENNPLTIPTRVSLIGDNLRSVTVRPQNVDEDIFYVNNGCYISGFTFRDHVAPAAAFAFNPDGSAGSIFTSPYIQNCSSITTTGKGAFINGGVVGGLKSMVMDSYTQYNQGGVGVHLAEGGYAQIVSVFTICCDIGFLVEGGATASISNSNCAFGNIGIKAEGKSDILYSGNTVGSVGSGSFVNIVLEQGDPVIGDGVSFDDGVSFYIVDSFEDISEGEERLFRVGLTRRLDSPIEDNTPAQFFSLSTFSVSAHTFEYVGSGTEIFTATPRFGGVPIRENEVVEVGGGKVYFTSTDQKGDFRIGPELTIDNQAGIITGTTFERSLFAVMTPYILAIEG